MPLVMLRDYLPAGELHYLSIADEALREGHLFAFTHGGIPSSDAAPLYIWIVMLGRWLFGTHAIWFLSLFSFLPAIGVLFLMDRWVKPVLDHETRFSAMLMLAGSAMFLGLAIFLGMDMLFMLFVLLALFFFWRLYKGVGNVTVNRILMALAVFMAIFTKGASGLLVPLTVSVTYLIFKGRLRTVFRYWGGWALLIVGGGCVVWLSRVWLEGGTGYLEHIIFHKTDGVSVIDMFRHEEPVWYYLTTLWYTLAPWSLLLVGLVIAASIHPRRLDDIEQFFLTAIISILVLISLFRFKNPLYSAPVMPFVVYLAAKFSTHIKTNGWMKLSVAIPSLVWALALPFVLILMRFHNYQYLNNVWCTAAGVILFLSGVATVITLWRRPVLHVPIDLLSGGLLLALFVSSFATPHINRTVGYTHLTEEVRRISAAATAPAEYYVWGLPYPESLDVLLGAGVTGVDSYDILEGRCSGGLLIMPESRLQEEALLYDYIAPFERHAVGRYVIVEIDPVKIQNL